MRHCSICIMIYKDFKYCFMYYPLFRFSAEIQRIKEYVYNKNVFCRGKPLERWLKGENFYQGRDVIMLIRQNDIVVKEYLSQFFTINHFKFLIFHSFHLLRCKLYFVSDFIKQFSLENIYLSECTEDIEPRKIISHISQYN